MRDLKLNSRTRGETALRRLVPALPDALVYVLLVALLLYGIGFGLYFGLGRA
jgi:hypothetical protein